MPKKGYNIPYINRKTINPEVYSVLCSAFIISQNSPNIKQFGEK